ncbi:TRAP transporter permease [Chloroflexota bacterium]
MPKIRAGSVPVRAAVGVLGMTMIILAVLYLFHIRMILLEFYLFILIALAIPITFLIRRATPRESDVIPWYDLVLAIVGGGIGIYFAMNAKNIMTQGWEMGAPTPAIIAGVVLLLILLEGTRRSFGWLLFVVCAFFLFEPLFSHILPGPLRGLSFPFDRLFSFHVFSYESFLGHIGAVGGKLLIGFLFFAGILQVSGGGKFFLDLAFSLFGRVRGAAAKVSVVASGGFGMLSGAPIPNILTTGAFTIPAMQKSGYAPHYAASVEACASTGGSIMPPVMGAAAFIMASLIEIPYWSICMAALLPAILYYTILFVQADSYAGRMGIKGVEKEDVPSFWRTLGVGFPYFIAVFVLIWVLAFERLEGQAPFYTVAVLLLTSLIRKETRPTWKSLFAQAENSFKLIGELFVLIYTLGTLVGSLNLTGVATTLSYGLSDMVGEATFLLPIFAALAAYILGIGLPATAIYIIMACTMAPALVRSGIPLLPSHLYCFYVGLLSYIIPPVALSAITAAKMIGEKSVFKVCFTSMRLGMGIFILPFVFIYNRSLLLGQAPWHQSIISFLMAFVGFVLVAGAFEKYLIRFKFSPWQSIMIGLIGFMLALLPIWMF